MFNLANNPILLPHQVKLLQTFFSTDFSKTFYLTGGTALSAFYFGHRESKDLDLFSHQSYDPAILDEAIKKLSQATNSSVTTKVKTDNYNEIYLENKTENWIQRIDIVQDIPKRFGDPLDIDGIKVDSLENIGSNKVLTVFGRAEPKDFIDLYFILHKSQLNLPHLFDLAKQKDYSELINKLLSKKSLQPNNGKKTDPAHPAIYPTGIPPGNLNEREARIYDLIVKRFMATFSEPATRETATIDINCKEEIFIAKGTRTTEKGWHIFYQPYVNIEEEELPAVSKNDKVAVKKIKLHEKETQPPKRYTPASIIKELEKRNLGTKATRSEIVDTLFNRGYVTGKAIEATNLGIKTVETLEEYAPKIVDEELTRHFEEEMEEIREGKRKGEEVLEEAKEAITNIIVDFKKKEKDIGKKLLEANIETRDALSNLGTCPACKKGQLQIRSGKFGSFVACNQYPKCKTTLSLPKNALIKPAQKTCETCTFPKVLAVKRGKRPMEFCLNPKCPTKHVEGDAGKEAKEIAKGIVEKECPTCKEGKLVLRGSIYGKFYGCSNYPKCKYTEKLGEGPLKEDFRKK